MKRIFVDTNVLIDLLADRQPFSKFAYEIFHRAETGHITLFVSSHSLATTHYLLKKYMPEDRLRDVLASLLDFVQIVAIDAHVIKRSLSSKHPDFEDAIQIVAAHTIQGLDAIVTRNLKDYKNAGLPVMPPDELLTTIC